jgi:hypothetical protein
MVARHRDDAPVKPAAPGAFSLLMPQDWPEMGMMRAFRCLRAPPLP